MRAIPLTLRLSLFCLPLLAGAFLHAQAVPATINYQGRLTDNTPQQNTVTAVVPMKFAIWDAASGGVALWSEPAAGGVGVTVTGGIFSRLLGSSVAIPPSVFTGATSARYLEITLNPGAGNQEILAPRQQLAATGYAGLAQSANSAADSARLGGVAASGYQPATTVSCPANQFIYSLSPAGTGQCAGVSDGSLSGNVALLDRSGQIFTGANTFSAPGTGLTVTGNASMYEVDTNRVVGSTAMIMGTTSASGVLALATNSTNRAYLDSLGNFYLVENDNGYSQYLWGDLGAKEGIISKRSAGGVNPFGLDFYTNNLPRLSLSNGGSFGVGTQAPAYPLDVAAVAGSTHARFGALAPLYLISNPPMLGFNASYNGGFHYGQSVGTVAAAALQFDAASGRLTFLNAPAGTPGGAATMTQRLAVSAGGQLFLDPQDTNTGNLASGLVFGGSVSGEGIASNRSGAGINPFGIDFYTGAGAQRRMSISNGGTVSIPSPGTLSVGVRYAACGVTGAIQDCACAAGETVVSGGGYGGAGIALRESRPLSATTWRVTCMNGAGSDIACAGMNVVCARLAP